MVYLRGGNRDSLSLPSILCAKWEGRQCKKMKCSLRHTPNTLIEQKHSRQREIFILLFPRFCVPEFAFSLFSTSFYIQGHTGYQFEVMYNVYESQSTFAFTVVVIIIIFKTSTDNDSSGTSCALPIRTLETDEVKKHTFS